MREELTKVVEFKGIGKVSFVRRSSTRTLRIVIRPFKGIQVSVPHHVSFERASKFVEEKRSWINRSQLKLARYEQRVTVFNEDILFQTHDHTLYLGRHNKSTIRTAIGNGCIHVIFPEYADIQDIRIQKAIRKAVHCAWQIEASRYLPDMVHRLARQHNLAFGNITIRDNKTRWGSCSGSNNISLNIHLMRLPVRLCEYVILHELAHTLYKHHQNSFWQFLDRLTGGKARELDKELNKYSPQVW